MPSHTPKERRKNLPQEVSPLSFNTDRGTIDTSGGNASSHRTGDLALATSLDPVAQMQARNNRNLEQIPSGPVQRNTGRLAQEDRQRILGRELDAQRDRFRRG